MRALPFLTLLLLAQPAVAQVAPPVQPVTVRTCPRADSILGPLPRQAQTRLVGPPIPVGMVQLTFISVAQAGHSTIVAFHLDATDGRHPYQPEGYISVVGPPAASAATLSSLPPPTIRLELADSNILSNQTWGEYPTDQRRPSVLNMRLTPLAALNLAQARAVRIAVGGARFQLSRAALAGYRDLYRTAVCGYGLE